MLSIDQNCAARTTYLFDVLESIDKERHQGNTTEHLVVVDHNRLNRVETLNFGQQDEGVEVVVGQHEFFQLRKSLQFFEVRVVYD